MSINSISPRGVAPVLPHPGPEKVLGDAGASALPAGVGEARIGQGALAGRQIAVGSGAERRCAQSAMQTIKAMLSGLSNALVAIVRSPLTLVKSIASYVMRAKAPQSEAIRQFHQDAVTLTGNLATDTPLQQPATVPRGLHSTAIRDWMRDGITIEGRMYGGKSGAGAKDMDAAAQRLIQLCEGNPAAAEWISRFANQQVAMPLMHVLMQEPLGPNGTRGFMFNGGSLSHSISALQGGGIRLDVLYQWEPGKNPEQYLQPNSPSPVDARSHLTARCSLRFELPLTSTSLEMPAVSVLKPLDVQADVRPMSPHSTPT